MGKGMMENMGGGWVGAMKWTNIYSCLPVAM